MPFLARTDLPWHAPRRERLLLALVALAALTVVYPPRAQDVSRLCLARAAAHGQAVVAFRRAGASSPHPSAEGIPAA